MKKLPPVTTAVDIMDAIKYQIPVSTNTTYRQNPITVVPARENINFAAPRVPKNELNVQPELPTYARYVAIAHDTTPPAI